MFSGGFTSHSLMFSGGFTSHSLMFSGGFTSHSLMFSGGFTSHSLMFSGGFTSHSLMFSGGFTWWEPVKLWCCSGGFLQGLMRAPAVNLCLWFGKMVWDLCEISLWFDILVNVFFFYWDKLQCTSHQNLFPRLLKPKPLTGYTFPVTVSKHYSKC